MNTSDAPLNVLVVDDEAQYATAIESYLLKGRERLGQRAEVVSAGSPHKVEDLIADGDRFDVALVDLGLGARQHSGLGVLQTLHELQPGVPTAIHSELSEDGRRLLLTFAAFRWFGDNVAALLPKKAGEGQDLTRYYTDAVAALRDRKPVTPDWAAIFRRRPGETDWFKELIDTPADLQNFRLFERYESWTEMVAVSGKSRAALSEWANDRLEPIVELIKHVNKAGPLTVDQRVVWNPPETDPKTGKRTRGNNPVLSTLTSFARSQSWFLQDPAVCEAIRRGFR